VCCEQSGNDRFWILVAAGEKLSADLLMVPWRIGVGRCADTGRKLP